MSKWAKYEKRYKTAWENDDELKDWIRSVPGEDTKAECRFCKKHIRAHRRDLIAHANTSKHQRNAVPYSDDPATPTAGCHQSKAVVRSIKVAQLKLAMHIACHSNIRTLDHLGDILKEVSGKDIVLHRAKCTSLIKRVLGPSVHDELLNDLQDSYYSLIIDEGKGHGLEKQLCIMVRYFSAELQRIVTTFLGLVSITSGADEAIFATITTFLAIKRMPVEKCLGLATDGCSAVCGENNLVITKFREICPNIIHLKCICHSLQLCLSEALKVIPKNVEFMVSETFNWFYQNTHRQQKYNYMFKCISAGEEALKMQRMSDIPFLSMAQCVQRVLGQFDELKDHFQCANYAECDYLAELLFQMYNTSENKLYLVFLHPILQDVNRVNKLFEMESTNPVKLLSELTMLYRSILHRIMKPVTFTTWSSILEFDIKCVDNHLPMTAVDFGVALQQIMCEFKLSQTPAETEIKQQCRDYMFHLLTEMRKRLPSNVAMLQSLTDLTPSVILGLQKPSFENLSFLPLFDGNVNDLEAQWNKINLLSWPNTNDSDTEQFWIDVANHRDEADNLDFADLGHFVLSMLALPFSNVTVKQTCSQMSLIKNKLQHHKKQECLEALLNVRASVARTGICCNGFMPSIKMLSRFNANIYNNSKEGDDDDDVLPYDFDC